MMRRLVVALPIVLLIQPAGAQQADDMNRVIDQGLNHSQVMIRPSLVRFSLTL